MIISDEDTRKLMLEIKRILKEDGLFIGYEAKNLSIKPVNDF